MKHPAMFPVALVTRILETYTTLESVKVLDPFAGSGSTLIASMVCGVEAVGLDINPEFKDMFEIRKQEYGENNSNLSQTYIVHDARKMSQVLDPESMDICITSPPYWNILNSKRTADARTSTPYSNSELDIANLSDYSEFLDNLKTIFIEIEKCLKSQSYFILNVMDIRKGSQFFPLHIDALSVACEAGFKLNDIIIWDRQNDYNSMRPLGYPYKFIVNKVHEYLLILRKEI